MFSSKEKCCLTCANWSGVRKTLFQGKEAGCNSSRDTGKCGNRACLKFGKEIKSDYSGCNKYEKWKEIK